MNALTLDKKAVAAIIAAWWKNVEENPDEFGKGPDTDGKSSADLFFEYAEKLGLGKSAP